MLTLSSVCFANNRPHERQYIIRMSEKPKVIDACGMSRIIGEIYSQLTFWNRNKIPAEQNPIDFKNIDEINPRCVKFLTVERLFSLVLQREKYIIRDIIDRSRNDEPKDEKVDIQKLLSLWEEHVEPGEYEVDIKR